MTAGAGGLDFGKNLGYSGFVVLATGFYSIAANFTKHFFNDYDPIRLTAVAIASVGYPAAIYLFTGSGFWEVMETHPHAWPSLGYLAILGAVGTAFAVVLFNRMLQVSSLVFASSVTYTIPVIAVAWGFVFGEPLGLQHGIGFLVILSGVYLVNRK
ncbi:MAG: DMT family transporter [Robiginitomaculum sp.]|nr:DMT family transporter [Robiginitomaculum sp.]